MKILILTLLIMSNFAFGDSLKFMKLSCEKKNNSKACYNLGNIFRNRDDIKMSDFYFNKGCKLKDSKSCNKTKVVKIQAQNTVLPSIKNDSSKGINKAINDAKNLKQGLMDLAIKYCKAGSNQACKSKKCIQSSNKAPGCKEEAAKNIKKSVNSLKNPEEYIKTEKKYLTKLQEDKIRTTSKTYTSFIKNCMTKMGQGNNKCIIEGKQYNFKEFLNLSNSLMDITIDIEAKKCAEGNQDSCYAEETGKLVSRSISNLQSLDKGLKN